MSSQAESRLFRKFPHVNGDVLRHLLRIFGGDSSAVQDQVQMMSAADLRSLEASLQDQSGKNLTAIQKQRVREFKGVSAVQSDKTAIRLLAQNGWDVENALNAFFSGDGMEEDMDAAPGPSNPQELEALFEKYKQIGIQEGASEATNNMEGAALNAFSQDLDPADEDGYCLYIMAFIAKAHLPMTITKEEFVGGLSREGMRNLEDMRKKLSTYKSQVQQPAVFREFYRFCYDWTRASTATKVLDYEAACDLWTVFFKGKYPLLDQWVTYIKERFKKAITRDVWTQFLDFITLKPDFSDYDIDGAWPVLFDEFVDYAKKTFLMQ